MFRQGLIVLGRSLVLLWDNFFNLVIPNILWSVCLVPGLVASLLIEGSLGALVGLALFVVFASPAAMGIFALTSDVTRLERLEFGQFWQGVKTYYKRGWIAGGINFVFLAIGLFNLSFYSSAGIRETPLAYGLYLWLGVFVIWLIMQVYFFAIATRLEPFTVKGLVLNSLLSAFKYPVLTLVVGFGMLVVLVISFLLAFLPLIFVGISYLAMASNRALSLVVAAERTRQGNSTTPATANDATVNIREEVLPPLEEVIPASELTPMTTDKLPPGVKRRALPHKDVTNNE